MYECALRYHSSFLCSNIYTGSLISLFSSQEKQIQLDSFVPSKNKNSDYFNKLTLIFHQWAVKLLTHYWTRCNVSSSNMCLVCCSSPGCEIHAASLNILFVCKKLCVCVTPVKAHTCCKLSDKTQCEPVQLAVKNSMS